MLACRCLNVIIETEGDLQRVDASDFSAEEVRDSFFKQELRQVAKLININKSHSGLIQTRNVDSWIVHYCINCGVHSHAVHKEKGASCVLVSAELLDESAIDKLRDSKNFSKLFKIAIKSEEIVDDDLTSRYLPNDIDNVIKGLRQVAADALKNESMAVEGRIKQFSDEQYGLLTDLREQTFREQQILTKVILDHSLDQTKPASTNLSVANPQGMPSRLNEPLGAGSGKVPASPTATGNPRHTPKRQKSCPTPHLTSLDTETLFEFDGVDDVQSGTASEQDESDAEEDAVKVPRRASGERNGSVAKSLPMTIPPFMPRRGFEEVEELPPLETNMDIAASIKALAKSVHGDTVFGDLPKPRYTYI